MYLRQLSIGIVLCLSGFLCAQSFENHFSKVLSSTACKDAILNRTTLYPTPSFATHGITLNGSSKSLIISNTEVLLGTDPTNIRKARYVVNHLQFDFKNSELHLFDKSGENPVYTCNNGTAPKLCSAVARNVGEVLDLVKDPKKGRPTRLCAKALATKFAELSY